MQTAKNANHPQGQAMGILVGLEYSMYRYLNVNAAYDPHLSKRWKQDVEPYQVNNTVRLNTTFYSDIDFSVI